MQLLNKINYNLYKLSNKKYLNLVEKIINKDIFKTSSITVTYLEDIKEATISNNIFVIKNNKIIFLHHLNLIQFQFGKNSLPKSLRYLVNINIKNLHTYTLIKSIEVLQKDFISSDNILDIKYLSHKDILNYHNKLYKVSLVSSNISTIINNTLNLKELLPTKYFVLYNYIRYIILHYENLSDKEIVYHLKIKFNISVSAKIVFNVRKKYNIPNKLNRSNTNYNKYALYFTKPQRLTIQNIKKLKNITAVYELLHINRTIYIGSTKDLQRRMTQYKNDLGHTKKLREFIKTYDIYFRYTKSLDYRYLEKVFMEAYFSKYDRYPILNCNRVL